MVTLCNRHGETLMLYITLGWILLCIFVYHVGWRQGLEDGAETTLEVLEERNVIHIDKETNNLSPGSSKSNCFSKFLAKKQPKL